MKNEFVENTMILAQTRVNIMRDGFRAHKAVDDPTGMWLIVAAAAALLLSGVMYFIYKRRSERKSSDARLLFRELCRQNQLSFLQRRLLRQLVQARQLPDPCQIFLDAKLWVLDPGNDGTLCKPRNYKRLQALQRMLFQPAQKPAKQYQVASA